jgi:hypothetical protein
MLKLEVKSNHPSSRSGGSKGNFVFGLIMNGKHEQMDDPSFFAS